MRRAGCIRKMGSCCDLRQILPDTKVNPVDTASASGSVIRLLCRELCSDLFQHVDVVGETRDRMSLVGMCC